MEEGLMRVVRPKIKCATLLSTSEASHVRNEVEKNTWKEVYSLPEFSGQTFCNFEEKLDRTYNELFCKKMRELMCLRESDSLESVNSLSADWYLRGDGMNTGKEAHISRTDGMMRIGSADLLAHDNFCVRPVLQIEADNTVVYTLGKEVLVEEHKDGEKKLETYIMLSPTVLLRNKDIGLHCFRKCKHNFEEGKFYDAEGNETSEFDLALYDKSEIKVYIDKWFADTFS